METKRKALGKGLEQLFSNEVIDFDTFEKRIGNETKDSDIGEIPLSEIRSNPYQPRKTFDEESLNELAESIKEYGVVEPVIVKKSIKGYELIAGERRCKAAKRQARRAGQRRGRCSFLPQGTAQRPRKVPQSGKARLFSLFSPQLILFRERNASGSR